jgi:hypothetical protein
MATRAEAVQALLGHLSRQHFQAGFFYESAAKIFSLRKGL